MLTEQPGCLQVEQPYSPLYCITFNSAALAGKSITAHISWALTRCCRPSAVTWTPKQLKAMKHQNYSIFCFWQHNNMHSYHCFPYLLVIKWLVPWMKKTVAFVPNTITLPISCTAWNVWKVEFYHYNTLNVPYIIPQNWRQFVNPQLYWPNLHVEDLNFGAPS